MNRPLHALLPAVLLAALLCASCAGDGRKPVHPVRGRVLYRGEPVPGALVAFHPPADDDPTPERPLGHTGEDGSFTLTTYVTGDGAPAGEYRVTVVRHASAPKGEAREGSPRGPPPLPDRYARPDTSGLRAGATAGWNDLPPFELGP